MLLNDALASLDFGSVDSESESDLDRLFVRTGDFDRFLRPNTWLALGAKGTGKSALFELFTKYEASARTLAGASLSNILISAGTGFGDLSEVATGDLQGLRDSVAGYDHDRLWRLYIAVKAGMALDKTFDIPRGPLKDLLAAVGDRRDFRIGPLLKDLWELAIGSSPSEVTISAGGANISLKGGKRQLDVVTLLTDVDQALKTNKKVLWLLFDKIDEIWPADRAERKRALEGLMTASMSIRKTFPSIQPKILLRTDLWGELDFTNKDHLTDKRVELNWTSSQLTTLLTKRALGAAVVREYCEGLVLNLIGNDVEDLHVEDRQRVFLSIFPDTAYAGQREAPVVEWLVERVKDGRQTVLPRDAIVLANSAAHYQRDLSVPTSGSLLSREAIRDGFTKTSVVRCEAFLAEFPTLREHFRRFSGQTTATFTRAELLHLMNGLKPGGDELLERLFEIGVVQPNTGRVASATSYEIPRLYRTGIGLVIRGRP